jgi:cytochrome c
MASQALAQDGDAARGQRLFNQQCRTCHSLEKGGSTIAGPTLYGLFGSKAGTAAGYEFSEAMIHSGIIWDDATVADYLRDPKKKVPTTKMAYGGIRQAGQVADVVAFLKEATK